VVSQRVQFLREAVEFLGQFVCGSVGVHGGLVDNAGSDVGHRPGCRRM
jgi:hypothetical protein